MPPMSNKSAIERGDLSSRLRRASRLLGFLILVGVAGFGDVGRAQSVIVRFLNGRNGKPITDARVYVALDNKRQQPLDLSTDRNGEVQFETNGAQNFQVVAIGHVACGDDTISAPHREYSIAEILKSGLLTQNNCGRGNYEPLRGRLLYFARRLTFWEMFRN